MYVNSKIFLTPVNPFVHITLSLMKLLSKEIFISLHTGKNGYPKQNLNIPHPNENSCHSTRAKNRYPKQNLKFPYPNEYSCHSTLGHDYSSDSTRALLPSQGEPACVPVSKIWLLSVRPRRADGYYIYLRSRMCLCSLLLISQTH